jgi:hypothetical protein
MDILFGGGVYTREDEHQHQENILLMMFSELSNNLFRFSVFCIQAVKLHPSSCSADLDCRECRLASNVRPSSFSVAIAGIC